MQDYVLLCNKRGTHVIALLKTRVKSWAFLGLFLKIYRQQFNQYFAGIPKQSVLTLLPSPHFYIALGLWEDLESFTTQWVNGDNQFRRRDWGFYQPIRHNNFYYTFLLWSIVEPILFGRKVSFPPSWYKNNHYFSYTTDDKVYCGEFGRRPLFPQLRKFCF